MGEPAPNHTSREYTLHVVPTPEGGWMVKQGGGPLPLSTFKHKRGAVAYARRLGRAVVVHERSELDYLVEAKGKITRFVRREGEEPRPRFGSAAGLIRMADDFDAPLEDFADYMPDSTG